MLKKNKILGFIYIKNENRLCGKCGKMFSVRNCFLDEVNRVYSPCCKNMINNRLIQKAERG